MKWADQSQKEAAMKKAIARLFGGKGVYYLLTVATVGLLLGANVKWHP